MKKLSKLTKAQQAIIYTLRHALRATRTTFQLRNETGYKAISVHIHRLKKLGAVIHTEYAPTTHDGCKHKGVASYTLISMPIVISGGGTC